MKFSDAVVAAIRLLRACGGRSPRRRGKPTRSQASLGVPALCHSVDLDEDLFIRADGSVSGIVSFIIENNRSTWETTGVRTAFGSTDKLIALRRALGASRVGFLTGGCALPSQPTGRSFGEGTYELTWYGWRRTTILFRIGGDGEPCSDAVAGLVRSVEEYAFSAGLVTTGLWTGD